MENKLEVKFQELVNRYEELKKVVQELDEQRSAARTEMVKIEGAAEVLQGLMTTDIPVVGTDGEATEKE